MPQAPATIITEIVDRMLCVMTNVLNAAAKAKYTSQPASRSASF
jgi:hypothetical protein